MTSGQKSPFCLLLYNGFLHFEMVKETIKRIFCDMLKLHEIQVSVSINIP